MQYNTIYQLYESGDHFTQGQYYQDCEADMTGNLTEGILVNRIDNLKTPQQFPITGLPPLVDQEFNFVIDSLDYAGIKILWSGTDMVNK